MKGFLPEEELKNRNNDTPWKKSERDRMIDLYLSGGNGASPAVIARTIGRNVKAVQRRVEDLASNEDGVVERYEPYQRKSRRGLKFTQNEIVIMQSHVKRGIAPHHTARLLCRDIEEVAGSSKQEAARTKLKTALAPTLDLLWAYRYAFFIYKQRLISDKAYDALVQEEIEYGGGANSFDKIKYHAGWPERIKSLALYLVLKAKDENNTGS